MNPYKVLQVDPDAEQDVIEAAYKLLASKYHPDKDPSANATRRMKEINAAYEILRDPDRRAEEAKVQRARPGPKVLVAAALVALVIYRPRVGVILAVLVFVIWFVSRFREHRRKVEP